MLNTRTPVEGGRVAIYGFYFQFWVTFASNVTDVKIDIKDPQNVLLGYEYKDQDNVQVIGYVARIVQVKFSEAQTPIGPKEANDILSKMWQFAQINFPQGDGWKCEFVLSTNRPMSAHMILLAQGQLDSYATEYPNLATYLKDIKWDLKSLDECYATINKWGREFGMSGSHEEGEIFDGAGRVFLKVQSDVIEKNKWLTIEKLEEVFVGYANPFRICLDNWEQRDEPRATVQQDLHRFAVQGEMLPIAPEIPRNDLMREMQDAIASHNLVIIEGEGGNGKSTLLLQFFSRWAKSAFIVGIQAKDLQPHWPARCVSHWRNQPADKYLPENTAQSLNRIVAASLSSLSTVKTAFVLDGLDEAYLQQPVVPHLVNDFWELNTEVKPWPALIVTCRKTSDFSFLRTIIPHEKVKVIKVNEFEEGELLRELTETVPLNKNVKDLLRQILESNLENDQSFQNLSTSNHLSSPRKVYNETLTSRTKFQKSELDPEHIAEVAKALRHPIVLKFFVSQDLNDEQRLGILQNQEKAWSALAKLMIHWFGVKYQERTPNKSVDDRNEAIVSLKNAGINCPDAKKSYTKKQWNAAGNDAVMQRIFRHAVTSGFVTGDSDPLGASLWQWRHAFLPNYLSNVAD